MEKREMLYEGKAKRIYRTDDPEMVWVEYKDDATAFNGAKKSSIANKGVLNNQISSIFFKKLNDRGLATHFVKQLSDHEQLVRAVKIIPIEVVVRNLAAGSMAKRFGLEEGVALKHPIVEFYYKNDELNDPLMTDDHVRVLELASEQQMADMKQFARKVNDILRDDMRSRNVILVDFKLEFGLTSTDELILADEISPDTCRFWDAHTNEKLDKDRFRRDLGGLEEAYRDILQRLGGESHV